MSTNLAQSATQVAVSPSGEQSFDFSQSAQRAANRQAKGVTRERQMLQRSKLISAVCADYRTHFAAIYGKTDRLPTEIFEKIEYAVDAQIESTLKTVNIHNVISHRRAFYHDHRNMSITERITNVGENALSLKEQHLGVVMFLTQAEKRLKDLEAKPTPDHDREKQVKEQIMKLTVTKTFIEGEMKHQKIA